MEELNEEYHVRSASAIFLFREVQLFHMKYSRVFVTVGTTKFDELIISLDSYHFVDSLVALNCTVLAVQIGKGDFPVNLPSLCVSAGIQYDCYRFKSDLLEEMKNSQLIISHCGAGSILEAMDLRKSLIVVVNSTLQGDHQRELSDALASDNYCLTTSPSLLLGCLSSVASGEINLETLLKIFPEVDLDLFPIVINDLFN